MDDHSYGVILFRGNDKRFEFLLVKHVEGHWGFPKGHPMPGEFPIEAARRELKEETGITQCAVLDSPLWEHNYEFHKGDIRVNKTVSYFVAQVESQDISPQEGEITEVGWYSATDALNKLTYEDSKKILGDVYSFLAKSTSKA